MRPTVIEINLSAIQSNLNLVNNLTNNKIVIAVVKADAYGLGSIRVAKALNEFGVNFFAVALLEEATLLRDNGIKDKILLLAPFMESEIPDLINISVIPTLVDYHRSKILNDFCYKNNLNIPVHIKVDTGMGRLGVRLDEAFNFIEKIYNLKNLKIEGIYTHFSDAHTADNSFTNHQINVFTKLIKQIDVLIKESNNFIYHLANSSAIICYPNSHFNAVRPGLMLYGCYPSSYVEDQIKLSKVISLKTKIVSIKEIKPGDGVSYDRTFVAKQKTKVAVIPIGYADGYHTTLFNKGEVIINNIKLPVIGKICMDYTMIDVTSIGDTNIGDDVILIGNGITEEEIASKTGLIPYEVLTGIGKRVPRIYIS
ncbi:MAG: alanine racemase [Spirochaetota bacterium]|nr:alanine racemase [Spirochaetota bacterium]